MTTPHKHHKEMLQYAHDAATTDRPWEWWEEMLPATWFGFRPMISHPMWVLEGEYRRVGVGKAEGKEGEAK